MHILNLTPTWLHQLYPHLTTPAISIYAWTYIWYMLVMLHLAFWNLNFWPDLANSFFYCVCTICFLMHKVLTPLKPYLHEKHSQPCMCDCFICVAGKCTPVVDLNYVHHIFCAPKPSSFWQRFFVLPLKPFIYSSFVHNMAKVHLMAWVVTLKQQ